MVLAEHYTSLRGGRLPVETVTFRRPDRIGFRLGADFGPLGRWWGDLVRISRTGARSSTDGL